jgi:hypothetical protein
VERKVEMNSCKPKFKSSMVEILLNEYNIILIFIRIQSIFIDLNRNQENNFKLTILEKYEANMYIAQNFL